MDHDIHQYYISHIHFHHGPRYLSKQTFFCSKQVDDGIAGALWPHAMETFPTGWSSEPSKASRDRTHWYGWRHKQDKPDKPTTSISGVAFIHSESRRKKLIFRSKATKSNRLETSCTINPVFVFFRPSKISALDQELPFTALFDRASNNGGIFSVQLHNLYREITTLPSQN